MQPGLRIGLLHQLRAGLLELREALTALKGPLGNVPAFRKTIQAVLADEGSRGQLLDELGLEDGKKS